MVTHNMNDAIRLGNRLIMMHEGHVIYDVAGDEKKVAHRRRLLQEVRGVSGGELANDRMLLSINLPKRDKFILVGFICTNVKTAAKGQTSLRRFSHIMSIIRYSTRHSG